MHIKRQSRLASNFCSARMMEHSPSKNKSVSSSAASTTSSSNSRSKQHQRSISAPKPQAMRRKSPHSSANSSRPASTLLNSDSRPASRSSNDSPASSLNKDKAAAKPVSKRSRQGRRAVTPTAELDKQSSSENESRSESPSKSSNASPTKQAASRVPKRHGRSRSVQLASTPSQAVSQPINAPSIASEAVPEDDGSLALLSKSAPTNSFLSRRVSKVQPIGGSNSVKTAPLIKSPDWDMPAPAAAAKEALTWQQTLLSGSRAADDSTLPSRRRQTSAPESLQPLTFDKQPASAIFKSSSPTKSNLTWQQTMLGSTKPNDASAGMMDALESKVSATGGGRTSPAKKDRTRRSRNKSGFQSADSGSDSVAALAASLSLKEEKASRKSMSPLQQPHLSPIGKGASKSESSLATSNSLLSGSPSQSGSWINGIKYAGPNFHNSPSARDLPVPNSVKKQVVA